MINLYLFNENDSAARFGIGTWLNELTHALEGTDIRVHSVHLHFNFNQSFALAGGLREVFNCRTVTTVHFMKWAFEMQGNLQKLHAVEAKVLGQNGRKRYLEEYSSEVFRRNMLEFYRSQNN